MTLTFVAPSTFAALALTACTASSDPYTLDHAQNLAVRAEPAHAAPGTYEHFQIFGCQNSDVNVWMSVESLDPVMCNACVGYELDYNW